MVPSAHVGGYDRNIVNLCAWNALTDLLRRRPDVARVWNEIKTCLPASVFFHFATGRPRFAARSGSVWSAL